MTKFNYKAIGSIGNYYGGLFVMQNEERYYWMIENYNTDFDDLSHWTEIDKDLYNSLVAYEAAQQVLDSFAVVGRGEQLQPDEEANRCKRCNCYGCVCDVIDGI